MMQKEEIKKLAELARITISEDELTLFAKDFDEILTYVSSLKDLKVGYLDEDVFANLYPKNVFREDENPHKENEFTQKILKEAPKTHDDFVRVDKILNQE